MQNTIRVSIILRAYNEEKHIGKLLHEIQSQKTSLPYEVILVDSGSTDGTLAIAKTYGVKLVQIKPEEFSFGFSLNKGIENSSGEFCVIISAHCYPTNENWLENLTSDFKDSKVMMVYGRQQGNYLTKYSEHQIFSRWFPDQNQSKTELPFCNNANCAIRKSLWLEYKYDEKLSGLEDLELARWVHASGRDIAYRADASVFHIHEETPQQVLNRYYREGLAYQQIYPHEKFSFFNFLKFLLMNILGDSLHAIEDGVFLNNALEIFEFRFLQMLGTYRGRNERRSFSKEMQRRLFYPRRPQFLGNKNKTRPPRFNIIDITRAMNTRLPVWPGSKPFELIPLKNFREHGFHESELHFNIHTATHMDAPKHFVEHGSDVSQTRLDRLIGVVRVCEYSGNSAIDVDFFECLDLRSDEQKILLKTSNSLQLFKEGVEFNKNFIAITSRAAEWLVKKEINLIGIDGPSIQTFFDSNNETHEKLLGAGVIVIEGLQLGHVRPGNYKMIALPLKIEEAEGSPIRAILVEGDL